MNTRGIAVEFRLRHWAQVIHERAEKGVSVHTYCETTGIHENTYYYWQRKLREAAYSGMAVSAGEPEVNTLVPKGWTALCDGNGSAQPQSLTVEVGGCRIIVCADTNTEFLAKICRILRSL
jgi:putative transposase